MRCFYETVDRKESGLEVDVFSPDFQLMRDQKENEGANRKLSPFVWHPTFYPHPRAKKGHF